MLQKGPILAILEILVFLLSESEGVSAGEKNLLERMVGVVYIWVRTDCLLREKNDKRKMIRPKWKIPNSDI